MLHHCDERTKKEKEKEKEENKDDKEEKKDKSKVDDTFQAFAVLGIALISMGEDIGAKMSMRQFNHLIIHFNSLYSCFGLTDALWQSHYPQNCASRTGPCERLEPHSPDPPHPLQIWP